MENWFYIVGEDQVGPRSPREIRELVEEGTITAETMMWTDSLEDWQPYKTVAEQIVSSVSSHAPSGLTVCPNCGAQVPSDDLARVGDTQVCPHCKEDYVQRIKEGLDPRADHYRYAGFWIRFCALFVDGIILWIVQSGLSIAFVIGIARPREGTAIRLVILFQVLSIVINLGYYVFFWGHPKFQATPGKMACRLRVVCVESDRVNYLRALGRYFSLMLSGIIFGIGFLMCIWDDQKRCLHDRICNTRVVRV